MNSTAEMLNALSAIIGQAETLQAMVRAAHGAVIDLKEKSKEKSKKEIKEDKPKREMSDGLKAWHTFNKRIDTVLKEAEKTFKRVAESKKFASHLKKLKATEEWEDAEILEEREKWVETPVETKVTEVNESAEASEASSDEGKKAGRPKMTEEEKAAAKVKRDAKKAAMTEEEIAEAKAKKEAAKTKKAAMSDEEAKVKTPAKKSKIGSAPGAPKKEAKVAWADSETTDVSDVIKELDEHLASE
jgi:hypothetical protein